MIRSRNRRPPRVRWRSADRTPSRSRVAAALAFAGLCAATALAGVELLDSGAAPVALLAAVGGAPEDAIDDLIARVRRLADGEADVDLPTDRDDAVGRLADSLEDLADRVDSSTDEPDGRERERRLRRHTEYTDAVLDAIDDVFYVLDAEGRLRRWNETHRSVTGYDDRELESMAAVEFFPEDHRDRVAAAISEGFETGSARVEAPYLTKGGEAIPYEFVASRLEDPDGNPVLVGIGRDVSERKAKEREAREHRERLSRLMDNIPGMVYRARNETDWPVEFVNEGVREISGYDPGALERGEVSWAGDVMTDRVEETEAAIQAALADREPFRFVYPIETADGEHRWVKEQGRGVFDEDGSLEAIEGVCIDITERVAYERELERIRDLLDHSQRIGQIGGWEVDATTDPPDLTLTREAYRIHELPRDAELPFEDAVDFYQPDDRQRLRDAVERAMMVGEPYDVEARFVTAEGTERWVRSIGEPVREDGEVVAIRGSIQDVSDRKERERELQRTTDLLSQAQRIADVGAWEIDVSEGPPYVSEWSDKMYDLFGVSRETEVTAETVMEFFHPEDRDRRRAALRRALEAGEGWDQETRVVTPDGEVRWLRTICECHTEGDEVVKLLGSVQDVTAQKERELALAALHEAARELLTVETEAEVADLVVETATDLLDAAGIAVYCVDEAATRLVPVAATDAFESLTDGAPPVAVGDDEALVWNCFASGDRLVFDDAERAGESRLFGASVEGGLLVPIGDHGVFVVAAADPQIGQEARRLVETLVATTAAAFDRIENEASLRERDEQLAARNERLNRQIQITEILRRVDQSLVAASTREEVETAVCERLVESEDVAFAWIGADSGGELTPRSWAGDTQAYLDGVSLDPDDGAAEPAAQTARTGEPTVVSNVVEGFKDEPWRRRALANGYHSVVSVPLAVDEYAYGVLTVYADETDAFDDLEAAVFTELGQSIANAINAVQTRAALHSDTLLELTLSIEEDAFFARIAREADCVVTFEGLVGQSASETRLFFSATGADAAAVERVLGDLVTVSAFQLVSDSEDRLLFEATVGGTALPAKLVRHGARLRSISATAGGTEVVLDVLPATDVREFVEMLSESYGDVELVSRTDVTRTVETRQGLVADLFEELTDRQREVLRTAYFAGFFEWPRQSTGEDVAEMLGVTQPTVNRHLRLGQQRLLAKLFEDETPAVLAD